MKKWIIIIVIVGLFGWAIYDFVISSAADNEQIALDSDDGDETSSKKTKLKKGVEAPDFELETMEGETVRLSDYRGEKVLLNFWGTWCPPCRAEMPDMQKFHENHDVVILAVNLLTTEKNIGVVEDFIEEYGITFTVLSDVDDSVAMMYSTLALPTSYLINSDGKIHQIVKGPLNYDMMVDTFNNMN